VKDIAIQFKGWLRLPQSFIAFSHWHDVLPTGKRDLFVEKKRFSALFGKATTGPDFICMFY